MPGCRRFQLTENSSENKCSGHSTVFWLTGNPAAFLDSWHPYDVIASRTLPTILRLWLTASLILVGFESENLSIGYDRHPG